MTFKCYCAQCNDPLYFEDAVSVPMVCGKCFPASGDDRDIVEKLLDFKKCGRTGFERVNLREAAAIEIDRLRKQNEKYRRALEVINGSADWLVSRQAAAALDNIGPKLDEG